ncbi:MAG TPA: DUF5320 domain-containing protein [Dehalococcoidia bacterium]|nr:DUF5320 domain-containing protein [Dehalococcoidia bacterium]
MPNKDGTGPNGKGPMTGRGGGRCIVSVKLPNEELDYLNSQKQVMKQQIRVVNDRISRIKSTKLGGK